MTDLAEPGTEAPPSTVIDTEPTTGPSGGGAPRTLGEEPAKPEKTLSLRDTVAAAVKDDAKPKEEGADADKGTDPAQDKAKAEKGAEKPEDKAKADDAKDAGKAPERAPDGKFAAKQPEEAADKGATKEAQPKTNGHAEPPARFLPDAKEKWVNTPRPVQRDVEALVRDHEAELARHREASERYEPIRKYDDYVRQNGRAGVHETLAEVAQLEDLVSQNPVAALNQVLMRAGPRKADGQPVSLFELAQVIVQQGAQGYQKMVTQAPQQQQPQNDNPEVEQLRAEIAQMREQQVAATVIEPFKADHPRYTELQDDIAFFLQSGKIPPSLSPRDRLEAAYDMAVRINPASQSAAEPQADPEPGRVDDLSGEKSIKSAPGAITPDMEPERGGSISDLLRDELKRAKRS